ncbi:transporter [Bacillus mycoides]|nr:transporter [Bacillus mycoides]
MNVHSEMIFSKTGNEYSFSMHHETLITGDNSNEQAKKLEKFISSIMDSYYYCNDRNDA